MATSSKAKSRFKGKPTDARLDSRMFYPARFQGDFPNAEAALEKVGDPADFMELAIQNAKMNVDCLVVNVCCGGTRHTPRSIFGDFRGCMPSCLEAD